MVTYTYVLGRVTEKLGRFGKEVSGSHICI